MALVLGCKLGSEVKVGDTMVKVKGINHDGEVVLEVEGQEHQITELERTRIMPEVWVSLGLGAGTKGNSYCRLAFEAPRSIRIERVDKKQFGTHDQP